jgi:hypothetical protein
LVGGKATRRLPVLSQVYMCRLGSVCLGFQTWIIGVVALDLVRRGPHGGEFILSRAFVFSCDARVPFWGEALTTHICRCTPRANPLIDEPSNIVVQVIS